MCAFSCFTFYFKENIKKDNEFIASIALDYGYDRETVIDHTAFMFYPHI